MQIEKDENEGYITDEDENGDVVESIMGTTNEANIAEQEPYESKIRKINKGSNNLHILPVKLNIEKEHLRAPVDEDFESKIKEAENSCKVMAHFRGRPLNGEKKAVKDLGDVDINYVEFKRDPLNKSVVNFGLTKPVEAVYHWKYDEPLENDENFCNINNLLDLLDVLA